MMENWKVGVAVLTMFAIDMVLQFRYWHTTQRWVRKRKRISLR